MITYMTPTHLMDWSRTCQHQANHMIGGCQSLPNERKRASRSLQKHFIYIFDFFFIHKSVSGYWNSGVVDTGVLHTVTEAKLAADTHVTRCVSPV